MVYLRAYLDYDSNSNESFVFALFSQCLPPSPDMEGKALAEAIFWSKRLVYLTFQHQLVLAAADEEKLLILGLEETNANWEVD